VTRYASWCAAMGRFFGAVLLLILGAACFLHSPAPLEVLWGPFFAAALVYGIGGPIALHQESRQPRSSLLLRREDLWPPGSVARRDGRCTHAGSGPCRYHGRHIS
jgi:hypothetical protein